MASLQGFNANETESMSFDPIPADHYDACIIESEMKPNKAATGEYLSLKLVVLTGKYEKRQLFARLNLSNPNPTAVKIAQSDLKAICLALGKPTPNDSAELHNLPLVIKVAVKPDANGNLQNEIKGYYPDGYKPGDVAPGTTKPKAAPPSANAKATAASWMKPKA
jgi:hypothetical protein